MPENPTLYDRTVCSCIIDTAPLIEAELRKIGAIKRDLSGLITQGAYSTSVSASAGTHAGGGVIDVRYSLTDTDAKRRAWAAGAAIAFPRTRILGLWPSHGHVVWRGCPHLAASAARQSPPIWMGATGSKATHRWAIRRCRCRLCSRSSHRNPPRNPPRRNPRRRRGLGCRWLMCRPRPAAVGAQCPSTCAPCSGRCSPRISAP